MPFGVHQIYEEIVAPVVQNLMQENRLDRLKIYNHIKDQKISYLNKWHQDVDASADTIAAFALKSQEFAKVQTDFEDYMERLKEDIDLKAEKFGHIEFYDAKLRDGHSNEIAVATDQVRFLDERRKPLALVNPLFAKTSQLPPVPKVEDITFEHISLNLPAIAKNALENLKESQDNKATNA